MCRDFVYAAQLEVSLSPVIHNAGVAYGIVATAFSEWFLYSGSRFSFNRQRRPRASAHRVDRVPGGAFGQLEAAVQRTVTFGWKPCPLCARDSLLRKWRH
jgi:hypothetical protein